MPDPLGYQYLLARWSDVILERASILYIWVTPEESRRKDEARAKHAPVFSAPEPRYEWASAAYLHGHRLESQAP